MSRLEMTSQRPTSEQIPGYDYGRVRLPRSPISIDELELLKQTLLFDVNDEVALRQAGDVVEDQIDAILDVWYGFVGAHPHLSVSTQSTSPACAPASGNGFATPRRLASTRLGSTTSTRSAGVTSGRGRTRPTR